MDIIISVFVKKQMKKKWKFQTKSENFYTT